MGRNGENWGARLKLTRYEEHWQAQAMAMSVDIIGIGATLGNADYVSLLILGGRLVERSYIVEQRGTTKNIDKRGNFGEHNWNWGWSKIKTSHLRD